MSFSIKGYQEDLKNKIESYAANINNIKNANTSEATGALPDNGMGLNKAQKTKLYTSGAFTVPNGTDNNATRSQTNGVQKIGSNAATTFSQVVAKTVTDTITSFTNTMNSLMQKLEGLNADKSALTAPKTTGQATKPKENLTMDNQGTKNDSTQPKDTNAKPADINSDSKADSANNEKKPNDIKNETKADNKEKTTNTNEAQTSSELDKAAQKQEEKEFASAQQKLQDEAVKLANEKAA